MISTMALGKSVMQEGEGTSSTPRPLAYQVASNDSSLTVKKVEPPNFDGSHQPVEFGFFLSGLREEVRVCIRSHDSTDIFRIMSLAREIELEIQFLSQHKMQPWYIGDSGSQWFPPQGPNIGRQLSRSSFISKVQPISSSSELPKLPSPKPVDRAPSGPPKFLQGNNSPSATKFSQASSRSRGTRHFTHQEFLDMRTNGHCY
ncbi:hypothetical protein GH714_007074 [Hevea brasiliensis]|uniref:Uncharacterized protein n=1 Tax=Hevea brasiliensis TaxID=3981 RepID=A0A6A6MBB1_HEVBR|nr:hypothetical protein GH714_007074 [Hevea brasiliensis]